MSEHVWTKEEQKEHRKLWIKALRSGEYKQGRGALRNFGDYYCCLRVACDIAMKDGIELKITKSDHRDCYEYDGMIEFLPDKVVYYYGLRSDTGIYDGIADDYDNNSLTRDNDNFCLSFNAIADIIESEPKGLIKDD